ncbi:protein DpdJ [Stigmatella aurantiaca]|uniref:DEAD/DEAH box helicase n=1 Tax=Stigmatella aurantiaca (strain DW4/3-1) TaxID=378806 RepID=Q08XL2_STIAD|nr:protein DpdJ [Stigmatella aurantiaca]ADO70533.1 DEAD/DEAH box helicase [Stigmatella aurantiaca DW4/3-1]EAU65214.1 putative dead/deah box helicase [Stigmatella aurantiaca DW4/3-1]
MSRDARQHHGLEFLGELERAEAALLSWGIVDSYFTREELLQNASSFLSKNPSAGFNTPDELLAWLEEKRLLWNVPNHAEAGQYRSRMAETLRLLARLRQIFPGDPQKRWRSAKPLVADFRLLLRPRAFPARTLEPQKVLDELKGLSERQQAVLRALLRIDSKEPMRLAGFQLAATKSILSRAASRRASGTIVCAGTGSGKTHAFYLPAFTAMSSWIDGHPWTKCMALYPRNELLKDQLRESLGQVARINPVLSKDKSACLSIGVLYGDVPWDAEDLSTEALRNKKYMDAWEPVAEKNALRCPLSDCPQCRHRLLWALSDIHHGTERLSCESCGFTLGPQSLRITRKRMIAEPPDLLFTTTEMLNRRMATFGKLFGFGVPEEQLPRLVLLDEVHTYEGIHGAQVALLLRRWQKLTGAKPHFVGLSATLADPERFFADLTGVKRGEVVAAIPEPSEFIYKGMEYLVALRGDPVSGASLLSTSIQTVMLMRRALEPTGSTPEAYGSKVFAFTDNLDVNNRLFFDTQDAEGWKRSGEPNKRSPWGSLATLRARAHPEHTARLADGQSWDIAEWIGHSLAPGARVPVERVSSLDRGIDRKAEIVVATSSLEVGFDDPHVGAVVQHKAPLSSAAFLQRKGRAGRSHVMRPWTLVVLSDFGRDRTAYRSYEQLFSPELPPRSLPIGNRHVLKMQATYVLLDWLSYTDRRIDPWSDLTAPSDGPEKQKRQQAAVKCLRALLEDQRERERFKGYLQDALHLDDSTAQALLWDPPRALLTSVIPTWLRQLERNWRVASTHLVESTEGFTKKVPLPEFIPATLFGDLNIPEVEILLKNRFRNRPEWMPIDQSLREFAPGHVSHRFSIEHIQQRNWIPVPRGGGSLRLEDFCGPEHALDLGRFPVPGAAEEVAVVRPLQLTTSEPPSEVLSSSNAFLQWLTALRPTADGLELDLPRHSQWRELITCLKVHTHALSQPVELTRYAPAINVSLKLEGGEEFEGKVTFERQAANGRMEPAALGFNAEVDALEIGLNLPEPLAPLCATDPELMRGLRPALFHHRLQEDERLDGLANRFQRDWLGDAYLSALALEALSSGSTLEQAQERLRGQEGVLLGKALDTLFMALPAGDNLTGEDDTDDEAPGNLLRSRRHQALVDLLDGPSVLAALNDAARVLWAPPDASWEPWLRRRVRATLGTACLGTLQLLCAQIDAGDLLLELDAEGAKDSSRIWLTEAALGGAAVIEAFLARYGEDPRRFFDLLESILAPSDFEEIDTQLRELLGRITGSRGPRDEALARAVEETRASGGHQALSQRSHALRRMLAERGFVVNQPVVAAIFARPLRPGSSLATDALLSRILADWDAEEARLGIELDLRLIASRESGNDTLEAALGYPEAVPGDRAAWRFSALMGLLWPRGSGIRAESMKTTNPYCSLPPTDRRLALMLLPRRHDEVRLEDPDWMETLTTQLVQHGSARLSGPVTEPERLREAILAVLIEPLDTYTLLVHPHVRGTRREQGRMAVLFDLPEAVQ